MDKELLQRYVEGNVTSKEVEQVVDWLDQDDANVREFMALHKLHDISLFNQVYEKAGRVKRKRMILPFRKVGIELLKIAAIFLLVWSVKDFYIPEETEEVPVTYQTFIVPAGQRAEIILPDSSKVWLNAKTEIVYPTHFGMKGNREVRLNGEAYFDVRYNPEQPFRVKTEKMNIQVLGTEFNVLAYAGVTAPEVALLEGSVELEAEGISRPYTINVNEQVRLADGKLYVSPITRFDYFKWREGLLTFQDESVATIMDKLQLYFDVRIDVRKTQLLKYRYTGKFRVDDGVEQVLKVLQLEHSFTYTRDRELNVITIK